MSNPNALNKSSFSPRDSKNLRCETLSIADYEYVNISSFAVLDIKLYLGAHGDLHIDHPSYSFKFNQSKAQNSYKMLSSFGHNFISDVANLEIFAYL